MKLKIPALRRSPGFALADLLATLAALTIWAMLALPTIGNDRTTSQAMVCLSNLRQIMIAWQQYTVQNDDVFVQNYHGGEAQGGAAGHDPRKAPWATGWLDWTASPDNTNMNQIRNVRFARLAPYLNTSRNIHKC